MSKKEDWSREELQRDYIDTMTAVTLPVGFQMDGRTRIYDLDQSEAILRKADIISLANCVCRERVQGCDYPMDVCISLDKEAQLMLSKGRGRKVTFDEALNTLRRSHEAGLVHISYTEKGQTDPFVICSCCACCCHSLIGLLRFGFSDAIVESDHIALQNQDTCTNCGICVNRCHFQARCLENGTLKYDSSKCFGCGLCISTCPVKAISMVKRSEIES